ncbi:MAG TPA: prolyl oligopeptidase family serine peptidase [Verrucomicrobiae bacterium]|nr:prolyl oligopeptidase family serine peptidase [Verrucomicrobiae bacterium]
MHARFLATVFLFASACFVSADGPTDNLPDKVRRVPPPGIKIPEADRTELEAGVAELGKDIESLTTELKSKRALLDLLPDVQIYHKAVDWALRYDEFYKTNEAQVARTLLDQGKERARALRDGKAPWTTATGLVVRGYRSKIDGSVQPYGLVVPESFRPPTAHRYRLDSWFHGRGETLTELAFINERQKSPGEFTPANAFVLHLYGRYCNANKFAGEVDLFEALEQARRNYPIDENRLVVRGFSMGGAACWQFAVHYAGLWAAAAPGAGFSETAEFLKVFHNEAVKPPWYEQKLWHWYDCTDYAVNLFNCPTVAYSGEVDRQKQAADMMAKALRAEGIELTHIIGPQTAHKYHPDAKAEINRRIDSIAGKGRDPVPRKVRFTTWTLRYNEMLWVIVDGMEEHWNRARVDAEIDDGDNTVTATTKNVSALTFSMPAGLCPLDGTRPPKVVVDGHKLEAPPVMSDRSWAASFRKQGKKWAVVSRMDDGGLRKIHGLQGPIDDAFMDSFLMVRPTGQPLNEKVGKWTTGDMAHAIDHWRRQFRGDAPVKDDSNVTDEEVANHNLILWGDPQSNKLLARIADRLPIRWDARGVHVGKQPYSADDHVAVLIYPNPLNPKRYVVLNSGFTFREYDYLNNARQVAKLPDWAILDVNVAVSSRAPGGIVGAGFFGEEWELKAGSK